MDGIDLRFGESRASGKKRNSGYESIVVLLTGDGRLDDNMNMVFSRAFRKDNRDVIYRSQLFDTLHLAIFELKAGEHVDFVEGNGDAPEREFGRVDVVKSSSSP